eukprot:13234156-Heterocapsa_arctica.AAC.1
MAPPRTFQSRTSGTKKNQHPTRKRNINSVKTPIGRTGSPIVGGEPLLQLDHVSKQTPKQAEAQRPARASNSRGAGSEHT